MSQPSDSQLPWKKIGPVSSGDPNRFLCEACHQVTVYDMTPGSRDCDLCHKGIFACQTCLDNTDSRWHCKTITLGSPTINGPLTVSGTILDNGDTRTGYLPPVSLRSVIGASSGQKIYFGGESSDIPRVPDPEPPATRGISLGMWDYSKINYHVGNGDVMLFAGKGQYLHLEELVERLQKLETTVSELQDKIKGLEYDKKYVNMR